MTKDIFRLNRSGKIAQRLEKQQGIRQERTEDFSDDNDTIDPELKCQLGNQTPGYPALLRHMLIDTHVGGLLGLQDSRNWLQVTETSLNLCQTSIAWELTFLDSDGVNHGSLDTSGRAIAFELSNRLSLSLEDSESGEAGQGASRRIRKPVAGRMVRIPRGVLKGRWYLQLDLMFFLVMGRVEAGVIKVICNSHIVS